MSRRARKLLASAATLLSISACAVGPDFKSPAPPQVGRYTETDLPQKTSAAEGSKGSAQTFTQGKDVPLNWWTLFGSDALNRLVQESLSANPDLQAASLTLRQAKENYFATRGDLLPTVDGQFSVTREKFNPAAFGETGFPASIFTLYDASVNVSYTFDVFGGIRRQLEAAGAMVDYERFEFRAAYLSLTANVVTAAVQEASLREQIKETQGIIAIENKQLGVLNSQFTFGGIAKTTVLEQQATLAQEQATLPVLEKQLAQTRSQLAVLAGTLPGNGIGQHFVLEQLHLPEEVPLTLPSHLVEQRPDIKAAEAQLHSASAQIGIATANMLPQFTITGSNYGSENTSFSKLFTPGAEVWSLGGSVLQPLFHGGTLLHQRRAAVAAFDASALQYKSTVLQAFRNVSDSLRALQYDADALVAQVNYALAASSSLDLAQSQFKLGAITYPQLLDAQRTYAQARITLVQAKAARLSDTVALFQALGGGWHAPGIPQAPTANPSTAEKQPAPVGEKKS